MVMVGHARVEITPPLGTPCALGLDDEAREILGPVYVRATVLGRGSRAVGLLSADLIGFYHKELEELRAAACAATDLSPERIVLHATHTHESPSVRTAWSEVTRRWDVTWHDEAYYERVKAAVRRAFGEAVARAGEATVHYGEAPIAGIASNRRLVLADGQVVLRASRASPGQRRYPEGWIDPWLRMVAFCDASGGREHWLLNYCCHPSAAGGDEGPFVSGDFPGEAMQHLERTYPKVTATYFTGCCGNINPGKYTGSSGAPAARQADVARMGRRMAMAAVRAREAARPVDDACVRWSQAEVGLRLRERLRDRRPLVEDVRTHVGMYLDRRAAGEPMPGGGQLYRIVNRLAVHDDAADGYVRSTVSALRLGELSMLFLPGECFLELDAALRALGSRRSGGRLIAVENCDYTPGYIVPRSAYERGGYEAAAAVCDAGAYEALLATSREVLLDVSGAGEGAQPAPEGGA